MPATPVVVSSVECAEIPVGNDGAEGTIKELITRQHGSSVLLGIFRLDVGQRGEFDLPSENGTEQEMYYLLAGQLRVSWADGEMLASEKQAILFPSGRHYVIETVGSTPVELIWTANPAPIA
jgi:mannose-6-phosphate isomerase-like protein (cupin superfamily)